MDIQLTHKKNPAINIFIEEQIVLGKLFFVAKNVEFDPETEENIQLGKEVIKVKDFSEWYMKKLEEFELSP
jgi:hypothetical protein